MKNRLLITLFSFTLIIFSSKTLLAQDNYETNFICTQEGTNLSFNVTLHPWGTFTGPGGIIGFWSKRYGNPDLDNYYCEYRCDPFNSDWGSLFINVNYIGYGTYNLIPTEISRITSGFVEPKK